MYNFLATAISYANPLSYLGNSDTGPTKEQFKQLSEAVAKSIKALHNDCSKTFPRNHVRVDHIIKFSLDSYEAHIHFDVSKPGLANVVIHDQFAKNVALTDKMKVKTSPEGQKSFYVKDISCEANEANPTESKFQANLKSKEVIAIKIEEKEDIQVRDIVSCIDKIKKLRAKKIGDVFVEQSSCAKPTACKWSVYKEKSCPTEFIKLQLGKVNEIYAMLAPYADLKPCVESIIYETDGKESHELFNVRYEQDAEKSIVQYQLQFRVKVINNEGDLLSAREEIKDKTEYSIEPEVQGHNYQVNLNKSVKVQAENFREEFPKAFNSAKRSINS